MSKNHFDGRIYLINNTHNDVYFTMATEPNMITQRTQNGYSEKDAKNWNVNIQ